MKKKIITGAAILILAVICLVPEKSKEQVNREAGLVPYVQIEYRCQTSLGGCGESFICCAQNPDCFYMIVCPQCGAPEPIWRAWYSRVWGNPEEDCNIYSMANNDIAPVK